MNNACKFLLLKKSDICNNYLACLWTLHFIFMKLTATGNEDNCHIEVQYYSYRGHFENKTELLHAPH